jgi:pyruvate dehydrogenase E2 component (dihydrolipoamide acetyltransferase)
MAAPELTSPSPSSSALEKMRGAIARAMSQSNREIPHYYLEWTVDMKKTIDWISNTNAKLPIQERYMPTILVVKAMALALTEVPDLNGYWQNEKLEVQEGIHVGFAISLRSGGLVIPALLNVDTQPLPNLQKQWVDLVKRAREGHLTSREVGSATITLTSLGERGADRVYGVIYPPQVALVGTGSIKERPIVVDGNLGIRPTMIASLAGDHRATDGHTGSRFLEKLNEWLQQPDRLAQETG